MDGLCDALKEKCSFLDEKKTSGKAPTAPQLATFLNDTTKVVGPFVKQCPPAVQENLRSEFKNVGWDVRENKACPGAPPHSVALVHDMLWRVADGLRNLTQTEPTSKELDSISLAADKLWTLDANRLKPGEDYTISLQHGKKPYEAGDAAPESLFSWIRPEVLKRPTFAKFVALLDNYVRSTGTSETETAQERKENVDFLNEIMLTAPMQYAHAYLIKKGKASKNAEQFKQQLYQIWFHFYSRETANDSSGFEHVFVGEEKDGKITGFHNWIQMYLEEKAGRLDYKGYIKPRDRRSKQPDDLQQVITIQFSWEKELKDISSSFIGVSPEFEFALYTMMFLLGYEKEVVECGEYDVEITTFSYMSKGKNYIGSAFPSQK